MSRTELVVVELPALDVRNQLAIAQHRDPVCDLNDLVESVGDEDDACAALSEREPQTNSFWTSSPCSETVGSSRTGCCPGVPIRRGHGRSRRSFAPPRSDLVDRERTSKSAPNPAISSSARPCSAPAREDAAPSRRARCRDSRSSRDPDQAEVLVDEVEAHLAVVGGLAQCDLGAGVGRERPASTLTSVDFPDPFCPTRATIFARLGLEGTPCPVPASQGTSSKDAVCRVMDCSSRRTSVGRHFVDTSGWAGGAQPRRP